LADLLQMQPYYTLRHAQPERQQELRGQFTTRIQELVRECSTEQVRAGGSQSACVTRALGGLRAFWLQQIERIGNAAALDEARLPPGHSTGSQQALKPRNFLPAEAVVDGGFGSGSRQAIARFQAERGLPANGSIGGLAASMIVPKKRALENSLAALLAATSSCPLARDLQTKINRARGRRLTFRNYSGEVDATNDGSERKLRPCVAQRKVTNGDRAMWAAKAEADLRTIIVIARLKGANPFGVIVATRA